MGLEAATYIHQLNPSNPVGAVDPKAQGDDHLRLIKSTLQATFPNITNPVTATHTQINNAAGSGLTGFAVPSVAVGPSGAAAGVATTALRSDAKLVIDLTANYSWTGVQAFNNVAGIAFASGSSYATAGVRLVGTTPVFAFNDTNAGSNEKIWGQYANNTVFNFSTVNDDGSSAEKIWLAVTRSAGSSAIAGLAFGNAADNPSYNFLGTGTITVGGDLKAAGASQDVGTTTQGWRRFLGINGAVGSPVFSFAGEPNTGAWLNGSGEFAISTSGARRVGIDLNGITLATGGLISSGVTGGYKGTGTINVADAFINNVQVGYRSVPRSTTATTLVAADIGKCVAVSAAINIPASVFSVGDCISIYNDSAASVNITISAGTLRLAGSTLTGTRALAARGMATLWFNVGGATPEVISSGAGVS
jgi:hypothetical protein